LTFVLCLVLALHPGSSEQELLERTLALVGTQAITLNDVRAAMALGLVDAKAVPDATSQLVDRELILREVQRYAPPLPADSAVEAKLAEIRARLPEAAALARVLEQHGFTEARLHAWVRDDLRSEAYLAQRFASASTPGQRRELITDWLFDLRRRTDVVILPQ
jgi:hypothetical protein